MGETYIVTELIETDLQRIIKTASIQLEDQHIKFITYQLIKALLYVHTANLIHRDIKPSNILVSESCEIKIWYNKLRLYL
jgi:mitogen-activated protein kinase 1/3